MNVITTDNVSFFLSASELCHSQLLRDMIEDLQSPEIQKAMISVHSSAFRFAASYMRDPNGFVISLVPDKCVLALLECANYLDMPAFARAVARHAAEYVKRGTLHSLLPRNDDELEEGEVLPNS